MRIAAQLIDAADGAHLWADRFDGSLEDVFDFQDKVAMSVAGVIEPTLQVAETARVAKRPTDDLTAYDLYLRAYAMFFTSARQIPGALRSSSKRLNVIRAMDPPSPGRRFAVCGSAWTVAATIWSGQPQGRGFCPAITPGRRRRPGHLCQRRLGAGVLRRGHRRDDGPGRSRTIPQSELRPRLVRQRRAEALGGPARACHRTRRGFVASQPACPSGLFFYHHWRCAFLEPPL